jgi:methionyl-tRNA formyltransferase
MEAGAGLVLKTVDALSSGEYKAIPQEELAAGTTIKHAPKIFKEDCKIDWNKETETVRNLVRGLSPYPTAWSLLVNNETGEEIQTKIFFAEKTAENDTAQPGTIKTDKKKTCLVACGNGWLNITDIQLAGKKRMKTEEFLRGFQQIENYRFV